MLPGDGPLPGGDSQSLLSDALADGSNLSPGLIEEFLEELTGEPLTSTVEELSFLTAKGIAAVINALKTKPVFKGKLFAQCRWLADQLGGGSGIHLHAIRTSRRSYICPSAAPAGPDDWWSPLFQVTKPIQNAKEVRQKHDEV